MEIVKIQVNFIGTESALCLGCPSKKTADGVRLGQKLVALKDGDTILVRGERVERYCSTNYFIKPLQSFEKWQEKIWFKSEDGMQNEQAR